MQRQHFLSGARNFPAQLRSVEGRCQPQSRALGTATPSPAHSPPGPGRSCNIGHFVLADLPRVLQAAGALAASLISMESTWKIKRQRKEAPGGRGRTVNL